MCRYLGAIRRPSAPRSDQAQRLCGHRTRPVRPVHRRHWTLLHAMLLQMSATGDTRSSLSRARTFSEFAIPTTLDACCSIAELGRTFSTFNPALRRRAHSFRPSAYVTGRTPGSTQSLPQHRPFVGFDPFAATELARGRFRPDRSLLLAGSSWRRAPGHWMERRPGAAPAAAAMRSRATRSATSSVGRPACAARSNTSASVVPIVSTCAGAAAVIAARLQLLRDVDQPARVDHVVGRIQIPRACSAAPCRSSSSWLLAAPATIRQASREWCRR